MAGEIVISRGLPDTQLYLQAVAEAGKPWDVDPQSGNYPSLVNNVLVNRRLANRWLAVNLGSRAFVDGMGVTSAGAESENVGFLRIPLAYLPPRLKRTLGTKLCPDGTFDGTEGNNAPFNKNLPHSMQTNGYDMKFVQEYDEAAQISKVERRMIGNSLDLLGEYTNNIPKAVGLLMDADIMATHIASSLAYAFKTGNSNIIDYDSTNVDDGYVQDKLNALGTKLSNVRGSYKEGVISYPREKSVFVLRWSVFNKLKTIKNGALVNSDIAQKILLNGYLTEDGRRLLGSYVEGMYNGIYIKVLPDEMWDTAAATLGLSVEQYANWNKIVGYIANAEGNLFGMSATVTDIDKSPTTSIGFIVRNDWGWGVKNVRASSVALLIDNHEGFDNPIHEFDDINSPANIEGLISQYQASDETAQSVVQQVAVTTPQFITQVTLTVNDGNGAIINAEVVVRMDNGLYATVSNKEDGTYTFDLPRASEATVAINASGYQNASVAITVEQTATATYSVTKTLEVAQVKKK